MKTLAIFFMCTVFLYGGTHSSTASAAEPSQSPQPQLQEQGFPRFLQSGSGGPVVVFENGLGGSWGTWKFVQEDVEKFTETFSYNRAGYKGTPQPEGTRDSDTVVRELRALLAERGLSPPYLLVGSSLGGLYMQYYARNFPDEVAGLVLIDSSHWDQTARMPRKGLSRVVGAVMEGILIRGVAKDESNAFEITQRQVRESPPLHPMPFIVLTAGLQGELWQELQRELADQIPGSRHMIVENSGHLIHQDQPDAVSDAIHDIVDLLRKDVPIGSN